MNKKNPKNKEDFWMFKAPVELKNELDDIIRERVRTKKDDPLCPKTYKRLGLAIANHKSLLKDLIIADMPDIKK